ncbi:MAG: SMP-30/gluconolactonase/LRE family protein [Verrucomicrobiia bacterium]
MFTRLVSVAVLLTSNAMAGDFQSLTVEKVAGNFQFTEGPVWVASKGELLFSDIPANRIVRWSNGKAETFRAPSGNSNGLTLDKQGRLLACEHGNRRVSRTEPDDTVVTLADRYDGKRLNSPNDIVCKSDGAIYFTDPPYGVTPNQRELDFQGVYRISPDGKTLTLLVKDFLRPNGIALSPDEKTLYVADTQRDHVRAFDIASDGSITNGRVFCQVTFPDGIKVDTAGNLYAAARSGVEVFDPTGKPIGIIRVPQQPANLAFGDADWKTLYIAGQTSLYRVRITVPGIKVP